MDSENNTPIVYDFDAQLNMSKGTTVIDAVTGVLLSEISGALKVHVSHTVNDKKGVDLWIEMADGVHLGVDLKIRAEDYLEKENEDDYALETYSVIEKNKKGWTLDDEKRSQIIMWYWIDTGRYAILPSWVLRSVFNKKWVEWIGKYETREQETRLRNGESYHSQCVFVPRKEVWSEIYRMFSGNPRSKDISK